MNVNVNDDDNDDHDDNRQKRGRKDREPSLDSFDAIDSRGSGGGEHGGGGSGRTAGYGSQVRKTLGAAGDGAKRGRDPEPPQQRNTSHGSGVESKGGSRGGNAPVDENGDARETKG